MKPIQLILLSKPFRQAIKTTMKVIVPVTLATSVAVLYNEGKKIHDKESSIEH